MFLFTRIASVAVGFHRNRLGLGSRIPYGSNVVNNFDSRASLKSFPKRGPLVFATLPQGKRRKNNGMLQFRMGKWSRWVYFVTGLLDSFGRLDTCHRSRDPYASHFIGAVQAPHGQLMNSQFPHEVRERTATVYSFLLNAMIHCHHPYT